MLKISSYYKPYQNKPELGEPLNSGDIVFCRAVNGSTSFYGIYVYGIGIVDLEHCSTAYMPCEEQMYLKQQINYWTVEKKFDDVELVIKADLVEKVDNNA